MGVRIWGPAQSDDFAVAATTTGICIAGSGGGTELRQTFTTDASVSDWCLLRITGQQPNEALNLSPRFARRRLTPRRYVAITIPSGTGVDLGLGSGYESCERGDCMSNDGQGRTTRLESLTDAVFGFSIALLIVSVEVPPDFQGLIDTMKGFAGFALSFAMLILVWVYHYRFFRHFKLEDNTTIVLNSLLLFVVLFYVYPLKYVFSVIATMMTGTFPVSFDEVAVLMSIYSAGFAAVFAVFALMYLHAYRTRTKLRLTAGEEISAAEQVGNCVIMSGIGLVAAALAIALPSPWAGPIAGFSYFLIAPAQVINSHRFARRRALLDEGAQALAVE
jgi:uncharacterized membrane protein